MPAGWRRLARCRALAGAAASLTCLSGCGRLRYDAGAHQDTGAVDASPLADVSTATDHDTSVAQATAGKALAFTVLATGEIDLYVVDSKCTDNVDFLEARLSPQ